MSTFCKEGLDKAAYTTVHQVAMMVSKATYTGCNYYTGKYLLLN